jgi:ribosomal protein L17
VPAAEYERLAKVDKLAGRLMQHAACITMHKKCKEMEPIVEKLVRVASEPTLKKARAKQ